MFLYTAEPVVGRSTWPSGSGPHLRCQRSLLSVLQCSTGPLSCAMFNWFLSCAMFNWFLSCAMFSVCSVVSALFSRTVCCAVVIDYAGPFTIGAQRAHREQRGVRCRPESLHRVAVPSWCAMVPWCAEHFALLVVCCVPWCGLLVRCWCCARAAV